VDTWDEEVDEAGPACSVKGGENAAKVAELVEVVVVGGGAAAE
jgi:hypothetical protein